MGFFNASILFIIGIIAIIVLLPAMDAIVGTMDGYLSAPVIMMCGALVVVIVVLLFMVYLRDANKPGYIGNFPDPVLGNETWQ